MFPKDAFPPYVTVGGALGIMPSRESSHDDTSVHFGPILKFGADFLSVEAPIPMVSLYGLVGYSYHTAARWSHNARAGIGVSIFPLFLFAYLPNLVEVTQEFFWLDEDFQRTWHV